jgi:hypothetical protein
MLVGKRGPSAMDLVVICEDVDTSEFPVVGGTPFARAVREYVLSRGVPNCGIAFWTRGALIPQYSRTEPRAARLAQALQRFDRIVVWGDDQARGQLMTRFPFVAHKIVGADGVGTIDLLLARYGAYPPGSRPLARRDHPLAFLAWAPELRSSALTDHELDQRVAGYGLPDVVAVGDGLLVALEQTAGPVVSVEESVWREFCMKPLRAHYPFLADCYVIGDNGAVGAMDEPEPLITPRELAYAYCVLGVDAAFALDHIPHPRLPYEERVRRVGLSLELTYEFLTEARAYPYRSFAIAHGMSPAEIGRTLELYATDGIPGVAIAVKAIRSDRHFLATVETYRAVLRRFEWVHFLGVRARRLAKLGVTGACDSFDTSGPLMGTMTSDELLIGKEFCTSLYIPPITDRYVERAALDALLAYERGTRDLETVVGAIERHWRVAVEERGVADRWDRQRVRRVLERRFWETCPCPVCRKIGIAVAIHRTDSHKYAQAVHNYWTELNYLRAQPETQKPSQVYLL